MPCMETRHKTLLAYMLEGSLRRSFYNAIFGERRDSDGRKKAEAYGVEEAGRLSSGKSHGRISI